MKRWLTAFLLSLSAATLGVGCNSRSLSVPTAARDGSIGGFGGVDGGAFVTVRKVDMLFIVDDSSEMRLSQDNLLRDFPTLMTRLMDPPGLPDLHIAVISTDMGAGDGSISGCDATGGKNGIFQYQARGACTTTARWDSSRRTRATLCMMSCGSASGPSRSRISSFSGTDKLRTRRSVST